MNSAPLHQRTSDRLEQAFADEAQASLRQALRGRIVALIAIAVLILFLTPWPYSLYYEAILPLFVLSGYLPLYFRRFFRAAAWPAYLMVAADVILLGVLLIGRNPLLPDDIGWTDQMQLRFGNFVYFYVLLAGVVFSYQPRLVLWCGVVTALVWMLGVGALYFREDTVRDPGTADPFETLTLFMDPHFVDLGVAAQNVVVFLIVAAILALLVWRMRRLALRQAEAERERTNLARYFSPNVVEALSAKDEPLGHANTLPAAVLFVDIVGFTSLAEGLSPDDTLALLRDFQRRMAEQVFAHDGTLDKYLGDGLMATFGTPSTGPRDAANAIACARGMLESLQQWNATRAATGQAAVSVGVGIHLGPVVIGDVGETRRMEFAVIGDTVNVASRLEHLTRTLETPLVASDEVVQAVRTQVGDREADKLLDGLMRAPEQSLRGRDTPIRIWTLSTG